MKLALPVVKFGSLNKSLITLVKQYNDVPENDDLQRIYYLQKINELLNHMPLDENLLDWTINTTENGWEAHLKHFDIHPSAPFTLKGMQFAQAVVKYSPNEISEESLAKLAIEGDKYVYKLMQARDLLLQLEQTYAEARDSYIQLSHSLGQTATQTQWLSEFLTRQTNFLQKITFKIDSIKDRAPDKANKVASFVTSALGRQVNNQNFICSIDGQRYIVRVEDRAELGLEQKIHTHPVASYFIEDYAVFRIGYKNTEGDIEYRPVIFSQFATQGNLAETAKKLRNAKNQDISSKACFYFTPLIDFCKQLMRANVYHPDIKLSNFLVHGNRVVVSDRKTFVDEENPCADNVRSSPLYAGDEYLACLNEEGNAYSAAASRTTINMPQFMAYQLGMALKEFLILTQQDELPNNFRDHAKTAASYFKSPSNAISNLSILVQELTRTNPEHRMTIQQFQELLNHRNTSTDHFYKRIEEHLPAKDLGLEPLMSSLQSIIDNSLDNNELLAQANPLFEQISERPTHEHRLTRLANQLANKCFAQCSVSYFQSLSDSIAATGDVIDLNHTTFHTYFPQLEFVSTDVMAKALGAEETERLAAYVAAQANSLFPRRDLIENLLASDLVDLAFIEQANPFLTEILEKEPIPQSLYNLAEQLAQASFNRSPYFKNLSAQVEIALLAKDWQQASWFRKAVHWLTAGFIRVSRATQASELDLGIQIEQGELKRFMPQLEFIDEQFIATQLDTHAVQNLKSYINVCLNAPAMLPSLPQAAVDEEDDSDEEYSSSSVVIRRSANTGPVLSSETMVISKAPLQSSRSDNELSSSIVIAPSKPNIEQLSLSSSIVFNKAAPAAPLAVKLSNEENRPAPLRFFGRRTYATLNTILSRGDDTLKGGIEGLFKRTKKPKEHVANIKWGTGTIASQKNSKSRTLSASRTGSVDDIPLVDDIPKSSSSGLSPK